MQFMLGKTKHSLQKNLFKPHLVDFINTTHELLGSPTDHKFEKK